MPILGYKTKIKNLKGNEDYEFIIKFKLKYDNRGCLNLVNHKKISFDCGDYRIKVQKVMDSIDSKVYKQYNNGIYLLSLLKYIVDKIPELDSISVISKSIEDNYEKKEIIDSYNKIKKYHDKYAINKEYTD